jgi:hypothetical protein
MDESSNTNEDEVQPVDLPLDRSITKALYRKWRAPRYGQANPDRMNNPVWEWLVRSRATAYALTQRMREPSA